MHHLHFSQTSFGAFVLRVVLSFELYTATFPVEDVRTKKIQTMSVTSSHPNLDCSLGPWGKET